MITDYEYWMEIKRLATERISELAPKMDTALSPSKVWWINNLIETNRKWLNAANEKLALIDAIKQIEHREVMRVKTFRANDE